MQKELKKKKDLLRQQRAEIDMLKKQTLQEMEGEKSQNDKYMSAHSNYNKHKIEELNTEINELKEEINNLKEEKEKLSKKLRHTETQMSDKMNEYNDLRLNFDSKLKVIEDKYREQIDNLVSEISKLRLLYMKKCDELYDEKQLVTGKVVEKAQLTRDFLKKKIIETRKNLKISMAPGMPIDKHQKLEKMRRSSNPITEEELVEAQSSAGNLETAIKLAKQKFTNVTPRPSFSHENDWNLENANIEYNKDISQNN